MLNITIVLDSSESKCKLHIRLFLLNVWNAFNKTTKASKSLLIYKTIKIQSFSTDRGEAQMKECA